MSCNICTCKPEDEIKQAEGVMSQNQVRRLPVCNENNQVVGILTIGDIAHFTNQLGEEQVGKTIQNICCDKNTQRNS